MGVDQFDSNHRVVADPDRLSAAMQRVSSKWPTGYWESSVWTLDQIDDPETQAEALEALLLKIRPWRKGPVQIGQFAIDGEWDCRVKWARLLDYLPKRRWKNVLDVGCNNGVFMRYLKTAGAGHVVGVDPTSMAGLQFLAMQKFDPIDDLLFYPVGIQDLACFKPVFDVVLCMGVLYHHPDPISCLRWLKDVCSEKACVIIEALVIPGEEQAALSPPKTFAGMRNVFFVPTVACLLGWCERVGFERIEVLGENETGPSEQRATMWSYDHSYQSMLNVDGSGTTAEGYPSPKRVFVRCRVD